MVRRAPLTSVSDTAHQVVREARIIEALAGSRVPVPTILAIGEDPAILGAPFFVMSFVDGDVVRRNGLPEALAAQPESHHAVGEGLIDTLVSLHDGRLAVHAVGRAVASRGLPGPPGGPVDVAAGVLPFARPGRRRRRRGLAGGQPAGTVVT